MGAICCLGRGLGALWRGLAEGRDGLRPIRRFSTQGLPPHLAGIVPGFETSSASSDELCVEFALSAAREARADAGLDRHALGPGRLALVMGTSPGDHELDAHELTERVGALLGIDGPRVTVSTACSSSTNALGIARDLLASGVSDAVLAGGADVLTPLMFAGFHALGVLTPQKCAAFSFPSGTSLGEGAGFVVLEAAAGRRAARARLLGYGLSCDAFHDTSPDPTGSGVARALRAALAQAGVAPAEVGYVNAHGTGTSANDPAEWRALLQVFGERARRLPVSSSKGLLGHAQAAAGALELITTLLARERGLVPQTLHFTRPRQLAPDDPVAQQQPRACRYRFAVSTNSAFGGANAALVIAAAEDQQLAAPRLARPVFVAGVGALGAHGSDGGELLARLDAQAPLASGRVDEQACSRLALPADPRSLDPSSRYLLAAATLALADAGLRRVPGQLRDRTGCIAGITRISPQGIAGIRRSIEQRGMPFLSATAFSRMVLNAPLGSCAKLLGLRGPTSTVSIGAGSGLFAMAHAAEWLQSRADAELMLAAGLDELPAGSAHGTAEGAACAVLSCEAGPGRPRLAGWGISGPARMPEAISRALAAAALEASDVDLGIGCAGAFTLGKRRLDPAATFGASDGFGSALALVAAALWLRAGPARHALVTAGGSSASCALVLSAAAPGLTPVAAPGRGDACAAN